MKWGGVFRNCTCCDETYLIRLDEILGVLKQKLRRWWQERMFWPTIFQNFLTNVWIDIQRHEASFSKRASWPFQEKWTPNILASPPDYAAHSNRDSLCIRNCSRTVFCCCYCQLQTLPQWKNAGTLMGVVSHPFMNMVQPLVGLWHKSAYHVLFLNKYQQGQDGDGV